MSVGLSVREKVVWWRDCKRDSWWEEELGGQLKGAARELMKDRWRGCKRGVWMVSMSGVSK